MPSGCTWSTSTRRSAPATTARRSPRWPARWTSRSNCPAASATTPPWRPRSPPAASASDLGTAALETPEWVAKVIAEHGDKIAVGLDVRGTTLRGRGWTRDGGDLYETLARLDSEGCARYVVTDINKDGTLQGPNLELLRGVCAATDRPVVASGGVSSLDDLRAIATLVPEGVEGAIVGKALYAKAFTLEEALEAVSS